jgi:DNA polymerase III sliding clamp (beta) subunit (PCNA family)
MKISRADLLEQLQSVRAGLSQKDLVEQSSCFVFKGGKVITFNDEVSCTRECDIGLEGAVRSKPLLELLGKLQEEILDFVIETADSDSESDGSAVQLKIVGKNRRSGIRLDSEIMLPLDAIEPPEKWRKLPEEFVEAVSIVKHCAGKDSSDHFCTSCVHIAPGAIEATDNYQMARFTMNTGFKSPLLVRRDAIAPIADLGMTSVSETSSWIHFKSSTGLTYSCRKYVDKFPDISKVIQGDGQKVILPKTIAQAIDVAKIFSAENADNDQVRIELSDGKVRVTGKGNSGWYTEVRKATYKGPKVVFDIPPTLLLDIVSRHNECKIAPGVLRVESGKFSFATSLGQES